jgi:hypothetical protein
MIPSDSLVGWLAFLFWLGWVVVAWLRVHSFGG